MIPLNHFEISKNLHGCCLIDGIGSLDQKEEELRYLKANLSYFLSEAKDKEDLLKDINYYLDISIPGMRSNPLNK